MNNKLKNIALVVSITVNLLIVGAAIGFLVREDGRRNPMPQFSSMIRHLEPDRRRALRPLFADDFKQSKRLFRELRDNQRHLEQALLTEPFDEAAAREAFKSLQKSSEAVQLQMHEQMIILMKNLNLEERKQVLKQIGRPPRRDPGKKDMGFIRRGDESRYNAPFEFSDAQYGSGKIEP